MVDFRFDDFIKSASRRSPVLAQHGAVASSQPLATMAGIQILQKGGNAADAAVATAAALNVTEPMSTGLGGDCFCLFYDAGRKQVFGLNGSGRAPGALDIDAVRAAGIAGNSIPSSSPHAVTVPGAAAGWVDTVECFGKLSLADDLEPAILLAEQGHPVAPLIAFAWATSAGALKRTPNGEELLVGGRAPEPGTIFTNPNLAKVFRTLATEGKAGFYEGWVADAITGVLQDLGGCIDAIDLAEHRSTFEDPISTSYRGIDVHEIGPNGQGIAALMALNLMEGFDVATMGSESAEYYHLVIESLRLAFADAMYFVTDPEFYDVPVSGILSKVYAAERRKVLDMDRATLDHAHGSPQDWSDTVYFCTADGDGNACSFINSNYNSFGTGIVPPGTGFVLQNRGSNFSLDPDHPNRLEPKKRPYHTIIPAMATKDGELWAAFGVMGGFMQPQGHVQVLTRMVDFEQDPQAALDAPRCCLENGHPNGAVVLEEGIAQTVIDALQAKGHHVDILGGIARSLFGRGQVIRRDQDSGVFWAGSDPRSDGCAIGF
jgi:gamma-glutamyltranspeptidase/glutathione hydrolase